MCSAVRWYRLANAEYYARRTLGKSGYSVLLFVSRKTQCKRYDIRLKANIQDSDACVIRQALETLDSYSPVAYLRAEPGIRISPELFRGLELPSLTLVKLNDVELDDSFWEVVARSENLRLLYMENSELTNSGLSKISRAENLKALWIGRNDVDFSSVKGGFSGLRALRANDTAVNGTSMAALAKMQQLEMLDLSGTSLDNQSLTRIHKLQALHRLYVADTQLSDATGDQLRNLPNLRILNISGTQFTPPGVSRLTEHTSLEVIFWEEVPKEMNRASNPRISGLLPRYDNWDEEARRVAFREMKSRDAAP